MNYLLLYFIASIHKYDHSILISCFFSGQTGSGKTFTMLGENAKKLD